MPVSFELTITANTGREMIPYLRRNLRAVRAQLASPLEELSLALVGDTRMADLHLRFMNLPGPTDVLTFPLDVNPRGKVTAGEVVVCVPEARRRCRHHGVQLQQEVLLYAVHGLLHLCGFDDRTPREFDRMHRMEDRILESVGVGPVFFKTEEEFRAEPPGRRGGKKTMIFSSPRIPAAHALATPVLRYSHWPDSSASILDRSGR